jgi:ribonuclease PH
MTKMVAACTAGQLCGEMAMDLTHEEERENTCSATVATTTNSHSGDVGGRSESNPFDDGSRVEDASRVEDGNDGDGGVNARSSSGNDGSANVIMCDVGESKIQDPKVELRQLMNTARIGCDKMRERIRACLRQSMLDAFAMRNSVVGV